MYNPLKVLCGVVCAAFLTPAVANVATTAGSNLTAYNGTGATNNNQWNNMMNSRASSAPTAAKADFGNCEAVILRCVNPKCSSGCNDASVARPIVAGCVNSNAGCKKHGDALIDSLTGQVIARSNAKAQEQQNAVAIAQAQAQAQAAAASAAAEQSNAQMQQMQSQMAAMQQQMAESMAAMQEQMAAQNEAQSAQIQSALEESRSKNAYEGEGFSSAGLESMGLENMGIVEQVAAKNGMNPDILVREQISGQVETAVEDAVTALKSLKKTLDAVFEYAGCDSSATNCTGPKRVKKFKDLANGFFEPYENVVENMYDALLLAMSVGIDVNDVIMLLSNSCNMWGKYLCDTCSTSIKDHQTSADIERNGACECYDGNNCYYRVMTKDGKVSKNQTHCRLIGILSDNDTIQREWIDANSGMTGATQVACASDIVMNVSLFRGMKKSATLDIETLRNLVNQDSYPSCRTPKNGGAIDFIEDCGAKFCMSNEHDAELLKQLENAANTKKLGKKGNYCFPTESAMKRGIAYIETELIETTDTVCGARTGAGQEVCEEKSECKWEDEKCVQKNAWVPALQFRNSGLLTTTLNGGNGLLPSSLGSGSSFGTDQRAPGTNINYRAATGGIGGGIGSFGSGAGNVGTDQRAPGTNINFRAATGGIGGGIGSFRSGAGN